MAYNPISTKGPDLTSAPAAGDDTITAPEAVREQLFNSGGLPEFYGVSIMEILEFGVGKKFNTIFDTVGTTA